MSSTKAPPSAEAFDALKNITADTFSDAMLRWLRGVEGHDPKQAYTALALYMGYTLAGAALELGLSNVGNFSTSTGDVIADVINDQMQRGRLN